MTFFLQTNAIGVYKKCPGSYKFFDGSEWHGFFSKQMGVEILKAKKVHPSIIKIAPHGSRGWGG